MTLNEKKAVYFWEWWVFLLLLCPQRTLSLLPLIRMLASSHLRAPIHYFKRHLLVIMVQPENLEFYSSTEGAEEGFIKMRQCDDHK